MQIDPLLNFLDHAGAAGVTMLHFLPSRGGDYRVGYFDSRDALYAAISDYATRGHLGIGIQPRPRSLLAIAPNRMVARGTVPTDDDLRQLNTVAVRIFHPDTGEVDSSTVAMALVARTQHTVLAWRCQESSHVCFAVPSFEVTARGELTTGLKKFGADLSTVLCADHPDTEVSVETGLASILPLSDGHLLFAPAERIESKALGGQLHRTIPARVMHVINEQPNSKIARLFHGRGPLGIGETGEDIPRTPAAYDRAFIDQIIATVKGLDNERDDLVSALWARPGRAAQDLDEVYRIVDGAIDRAQQARAAARQGGGDGTGGQPPIPEYDLQRVDPGEPLHRRLWYDYFEYADSARRWVTNVHRTIMAKAQKVVQFLEDQNAQFFHYRQSDEIVFVANNQQHIVDVHDPNYVNWFLENVTFFAPGTTKGKELTVALRAAIRKHPDCHEAESAKWGYFDRLNEALYICLDPDQTEIVRIRAAQDGQPDVSVVANGTDNVTLRGPTARSRRFVYQGGKTAQAFTTFRETIHRGQALDTVDRMASTCFNLAMLIPDQNQRPIKLHCGDTGAGKSFAAYEWETVLYGRKYAADYNDKPALLQALKLAGPMVTQDNIEASLRKKFQQIYLVAATGSALKLRKYYTESQAVTFEPNANILLTAIEPLDKAEEIRRIFEFRFATEHKQKRRGSGDLRQKKLEAEADTVMSGILDAFSLYVLPGFADRLKSAVDFIEYDCVTTAKHAFADYLSWMLVFAETLGVYLAGDSSFDARKFFADYMERLSNSERTARLETDIVLATLERFKIEGCERIHKSNPGGLAEPKRTIHRGLSLTWDPTVNMVTIGPATTAALYQALAPIARGSGQEWYEHPRALGARLTMLEKDPILKELGWTRRKLAQKAHNNVQTYVYVWMPTAADPILIPETTEDDDWDEEQG